MSFSLTGFLLTQRSGLLVWLIYQTVPRLWYRKRGVGGICRWWIDIPTCVIWLPAAPCYLFIASNSYNFQEMDSLVYERLIIWIELWARIRKCSSFFFIGRLQIWGIWVAFHAPWSVSKDQLTRAKCHVPCCTFLGFWFWHLIQVINYNIRYLMIADLHAMPPP